MLSISTCWNGHRHHENGRHMGYETILLGFEYLFLGQGLSEELMPGFFEIAEQNKQSPKPALKFSGVHSFCYNQAEGETRSDQTQLISPDKNQRDLAIRLTKKSIDLAAQLDAGTVILQLGQTQMDDYSSRLLLLLSEGELYSKAYAALKLEMIQARENLHETHLDAARHALDELIPYADEKGVQLALQNQELYELAPNEREIEILLTNYKSPTLGYWHDFGYAQLKENFGLLDHCQYLEEMQTQMIGCNLHDVVWPKEDHSIPLKGGIDFDQLMPLVPKNITKVWTLDPRRKSNDIKAALVTWKEKYGD